MIRTLVCCLFVLMLTSHLPAARAQDAAATSIFGNCPPVFTEGNPYSAPLKQSRADLEQAIAHFWQVYGSNPWNYWAVLDAYYAYANAYRTYRWNLELYWNWESSHHSFSGRVLSRDYTPIWKVLNGVQAVDETAMMKLPPEFPVDGATVTLTRAPIIYAQPVAAGAAVDPKAIGQPAIDPMPPAPFLRAQSGPDGRFKLNGLANGSYRYTVFKQGFRSASGTVEIGSDAQDRDIYLTRYRILSGTVVTVARDIIPILRPMMAKTGASGSSADEVEQALSSDQKIAPNFRRLIPLEGARVTLHPRPILFRAATGGALPQTNAPAVGPVSTDTPAAVAPVPGDAASTAAAEPTEISDAALRAECIEPELFRALPPLNQATTDGSGAFKLEGLPFTSYRVTVEKDGFIPFNAILTLDRSVTHRRILLVPLLEGDPFPRPVPMNAEPTAAPGSTVNDPFNAH